MASLLDTITSAVKKVWIKWADIMEKIVPIKEPSPSQLPRIVWTEANKIATSYDTAPNKFAFKSTLSPLELNVLDRLRPEHKSQKSTPIFDAPVKVEPIKWATTLTQAPSNLESFESQLSRNPVTWQRETGWYFDQVITMWKNAPEALWSLLEKQVPVNTSIWWLDVRKTAKAAWTTIWSPIAAIPSVWVWLEWWIEWVQQAKWAKDTFVKMVSLPVKTFMPIMDLIPWVLAFKFGTQATWLDKYTTQWTESAKEWVAKWIEMTWFFNSEQSKELASDIVDGSQFLLSFIWWAKSSKAWWKEKVSALQREVEIGNTVKSIREEGIKSWLSKKEATQVANEMLPVIRNSKPNTLLSDAQVLSSNLKNIGIDVAANSVIPVIWLAYNSYKNWEQTDFLKAIKESAIQVAAWVFPWAKALKSKPSEAQLKLDTEAPAKSETPTTAIPKETSIASVKEVTPPVAKSEPAPVLNAEPAIAAIKKAKKITKKWEAPAPSDSNAIFMQKYRETEKQIADKKAEQDYIDERASQNELRNIERDKVVQDFAAKQEAKWQKLADIVMWKVLKGTDESMARRQEAADLQASRDAETQAFADILNAEKRPEFVTEFLKTNPTVEQAAVATDMRNKMDQWESAAKIMRSTLLSRAQKEAIVKDYQAWLTESRTVPTKTLAETVAEANKKKTPEDLDFIDKDKASQYKKDAEFAAWHTKALATEGWPAKWYTLKFSRLLWAVWQFWKQIADRVSLWNINRVLKSGKVVDMQNYISSSHDNISKWVEDNFIKYAWPTLNDTKKFDTFDYTWNNDDFIGKQTPQWVEITPENVWMIRKAQDNTRKLFTGKDQYPLIPWTTLDQTVNISNASNIYKLVRWDEAAVSRIFTPEQRAILEGIYNSVEAKYWAWGKQMIDDWLYSQSNYNEWYRRFVMWRDNYNNLPKQYKSEIELTLSDGSVRKFDNIEEAQSFVRRELVNWKKLTPSMENLSSLAQSKWGSQLDLFRIHWDVPAILSYGKQLWEVYADVHLQKELNAMAADKRTAKYVQDIRNNIFWPGLEDRLLWLSQQKWGWTRNISGLLAWATFWVPTYLTGWVAATIKNVADWIVSMGINLWKWRGKAMAQDFKSIIWATPWTLSGYQTEAKKVMQSALASEWFVQKPELFEWISWAKYLHGITWGFQDNVVKSQIALRWMRRVLLDHWYNKVYTDADILSSWDKFKNEKVDDYLYERNNIYNDTLMAGDLSRQAQASFIWWQKVLWPVKTFQTWLVSRFLNDARTVVSWLTLKEWSVDKVQVAKAAERIIRNIAWPVVMYNAILWMLPDDMEDDIKKKIASAFQKRYWSTQFEDVATMAWWLIDMIPVEKAMQLAKVVTDAWLIYEKWRNDNVDYHTILDAEISTWLNNLAKAIAPIRDISNAAWVATGKSLQDILSEKAWVTNLEDATRYWLDKWSRWSNLKYISKLMWVNLDDTINNYIKNPEAVVAGTAPIKDTWYGRLADTMLTQINPLLAWKEAQVQRNLEDSIIWTAANSTAAQLGMNWAPVQEDTWVGKRAIEKQMVYNVQEALSSDFNGKDDNESMKNLLVKSDIDPRWSQYVLQEYNKHLASMKKENDTAESQIGSYMYPKDITATGLQWQLQELAIDNKKAYADFVGWLADFTLAESARKWKWDAITFTGDNFVNWNIEPNTEEDKKYFDTVKKTYGKVSSNAAQAIADYRDEKSLVTSAISGAYTLLWNIAEMKKEDAQKALDIMDKYLGFLERNSKYTGNHLDAAALKSFDTAPILEWLASKWIKIGSQYKNVIAAIIGWLWLRGEETSIDLKQSPVATQMLQWAWPSSWTWYTQGSTTWDGSLSSLLSSIWTWQKIKPLKLELPSGWKVAKVWWVWAQKSLAELLNSPWMKQAMSRWQQLQTREPLATFSKSLNRK